MWKSFWQSHNCYLLFHQAHKTKKPLNCVPNLQADVQPHSELKMNISVSHLIFDCPSLEVPGTETTLSFPDKLDYKNNKVSSSLTDTTLMLQKEGRGLVEYSYAEWPGAPRYRYKLCNETGQLFLSIQQSSSCSQTQRFNFQSLCYLEKGKERKELKWLREIFHHYPKQSGLM